MLVIPGLTRDPVVNQNRKLSGSLLEFILVKTGAGMTKKKNIR
jgi:hypothetical protein